jgi:hypothetical protein
MFKRQRRWRHPWEKGDPAERALGAAFRILLDSRTWKRHPEPFSKSQRGRERREERHFVDFNKRFARA